MGSLHIAQLVGSVMLLLLVAVATLVASKRSGLPFTVLLVVIGIALGASESWLPPQLHTLLDYRVSPDVILFVFLPTLIFESAFALDGRELRENLGPILTLAVPGLLVSTALIGGLIALLTPVPLVAALLLGSILSATDPVAVIAIFKQVGAPKRLSVLVEGESLLNDATAIVVSRILTTLLAAGYFTFDTLLEGATSFLLVFSGGALVGWITALVTGYLLGRVRNDPLLEITLTTALAYLSFIIAEELHVSGVMSTVVAGVTMGGWGRCKISAPVVRYLDSFWEYMAFVANALIFLLVGLRVELPALIEAAPLLSWVIIAMLVSRALVVYTLVPLVSRFSGTLPVNLKYQTVIYWGGLRGAIALAIVLSLPEFAQRDTFIVVVTGAVLFTLLVQGLSMQRLVHYLRLDEAPLIDRLQRAESTLMAQAHALEKLPELQRGGLFSASLADQQRDQFGKKIARSRNLLRRLLEQAQESMEQQRLLMLRCLTLEKNHYYRMLASAQISEATYRELRHQLDQLVDLLRHGGSLSDQVAMQPLIGVEQRVRQRVRNLPMLSALLERMELTRTERDYEKSWALYQGARWVLQELDELVRAESVSAELEAATRSWFGKRQQHAQALLDLTAQQFPEFATAIQQRMASRLLLNAEKQYLQERSEGGQIPAAIGQRLIEELDLALNRLRGSEKSRLLVDAEELLRKVPMFQHLTPVDAVAVTEMLHPHTVPAGEVIIRQGDPGDSLFLIARGVIRICRDEDESGSAQEVELATLMAGDYFGEMALLTGEPRTATCRAVSPCALYELKEADFAQLLQALPAVRESVERAAHDRSLQQQAIKLNNNHE